MITYHDCEQGTVKWKLLRKGLWTGSIALRLLQGKKLPEDSDWGGNDATRRGHALESVAIMEYERKYRRKVARHGFITNSVYTNAGYSPDGIDGRILLEIKCFNGVRHEALVAGNIPIEVQVQMFFGMIITGCRRARLIAFNPEYEQQLTVIEITYDKIIGNNIRSKLKADMKRRQLLS